MLLVAEGEADGDEWDFTTALKRRRLLPSHLILLDFFICTNDRSK
jgi:hypothetical protein